MRITSTKTVMKKIRKIFIKKLLMTKVIDRILKISDYNESVSCYRKMKM